jgi:phosphoribosylglycinamide formyltransferase-1
VRDVAMRAPIPLVPLPAKLAVLLSGRGSNFEAIADACQRGDLPARLVLVLSDNPTAPGLAKAGERGIPTRALPRSEFGSKGEHEAAISLAIEQSGADLVCLAGFMRLLSAAFVERFPMRILNVHPSLLPSFPGLEAQAQAVRYGVRVSGATVHFVDAGTDTGPIVDQEPILVRGDDDVRSLAGRTLAVEHALYVRALRKVLEGGWIVDGRRIDFPRESVPGKFLT